MKEENEKNETYNPTLSEAVENFQVLKMQIKKYLKDESEVKECKEKELILLTSKYIDQFLNQAKVNRFRKQWENNIEDNYGSIMPIMIYRVTWIDREKKNHEYWSSNRHDAHMKKSAIDHSNGEFEYSNFEGWYAYRTEEHDKRFGAKFRESEWWEAKNRY
jgi:hypothetical protein